MGKKQFDRPLILRGHQIPNRIGLAPIGSTVYSDDSCMTEESIRLYTEIAKGGTGLLIQGCAVIAPEAMNKKRQLGIWSDTHIPGLRRMTEAVHAQGKVIVAQLQHGGIRCNLETPPGPSALTLTVGKKKKMIHEMSLEEIRTSQQQFLDAALRAARAGYDGIELHCSHGYLISSFLSPVTNRRTDAYGQDHLLYLREVFQMVRAEVPDQFIVGVRISGYVPDLETGLEQARQIDALDADYISVSVNYKVGFLQQGDTVPEGYPFDPMIYAAQEIKKQVQCPVFAAKGIRTGEMAERVLEGTGVDMVLVGRGHLCDQEWTAKAFAGQEPNRCCECKGECRWRLGECTCPSLILRSAPVADLRQCLCIRSEHCIGNK